MRSIIFNNINVGEGFDCTVLITLQLCFFFAKIRIFVTQMFAKILSSFCAVAIGRKSQPKFTLVWYIEKALNRELFKPTPPLVRGQLTVSAVFLGQK